MVSCCDSDSACSDATAFCQGGGRDLLQALDVKQDSLGKPACPVHVLIVIRALTCPAPTGASVSLRAPTL